MRLAMHRINDNHRMYRIAEHSTKVRPKRSGQMSAAAMLRKKKLMLGDALAKSGRHELRLIEVVLLDGSVLLRGRVDCFYLKQLAQESVRTIANGMRIINRIMVD